MIDDKARNQMLFELSNWQREDDEIAFMIKVIVQAENVQHFALLSDEQLELLYDEVVSMRDQMGEDRY